MMAASTTATSTKLISGMRLSTFGALPCAQCGTQLSKPAWSEPVSERQVRHLWNCQDCGYVFETLVVFSAAEVADEAAPLAA
jgi:ribosomal protein L37AE/L43A